MTIVIKPSPVTHPGGVLTCFHCKKDHSDCACHQPLLPYHRWPRSYGSWPRSYGGWQAGSIIRCEGEDCQWCKDKWTLVDPKTLEDMDGGPTATTSNNGGA